MPLMKLLTRFLKNKAHRDYQRLQPIVEDIKALRAEFEALSDEDLQAKTPAFKARIAAGESTDDLLVEAFATVWEAAHRLAERKVSWDVTGSPRVWDMIPYDVQLIGGIALHQGNCAEMATGEGKTLVATMPLYLNALTGRGAHLVTVNDYLALRDSEWMGGVFAFLGLTTGCILGNMTPAARREAYGCDITYGTNNEFGFDYLRDNMAQSPEQLVQREYHFAIIDEVDSVLIDEARTPLIISGPVAQSTDRFGELQPHVDSLVRKQTRLLNDYMVDVEKVIASGAKMDDETATKLLRASRGGPKMPRFIKLLKEPGIHDVIRSREDDYMREKAMQEADADLYYIIEEKQNSCELTERGQGEFGLGDEEFFILPDLATEMGKIDENEGLAIEEKATALDQLHRLYGERSEGIHAVNQLLKAYTLFAKDDEYVVNDGRIMIVDENTGRLMEGRRFSDGLHSALEAKEGLKIQGETQTYATVTLQNFFRMYEKLAGMTGTAETEEGEFHEIYDLDMMVIPTHRPITRQDMDDLIYRTKREKMNAVLGEIESIHKTGLPVLVGTTTVEMSETLSRMLRRRGVKHNVLNAKQHDREAQIVADAGQMYAVTIATNMAGRGTDIKLGEGVLDIDTGDPNIPPGLQIIGCARHESRRIDRQLRGRAGRQGDPGSSKFYVSLEDDLMRLFNSDRVMKIMDKLGLEEGEVITHPMVTRAIEQAQKRVEAHNFSIRKRLIDYDDVMNRQREVVYGIRRDALLQDDMSVYFLQLLEEDIEELLDAHADEQLPAESWNWHQLSLEFAALVLRPLPVADDERATIGRERLATLMHEAAKESYEAKQARLGEELCRRLEGAVVLRTIDSLWKDHLHELDSVRSGIGLRSYAQKDPLLEYKSESFRLFEQMMAAQRKETVSTFFRAEVAIAPREESPMAQATEHKADAASASAPAGIAPPAPSGPAAPIVGAGGSAGPMQGVFAGAKASKASPTGAPAKAQPTTREMPKVGRNDPCPCGSGKKFKKCHG